MFYPSESEFIALSKHGNLIPVYKEIMADMETPVSAFARIRSPHAFLLESVEGSEKIGRYSFLGSRPVRRVWSKGSRVVIEEGRKRERVEGDPLGALRKIFSRYRAVAVEGLPRFYGGAVGYLGYDLVRFLEQIPDKNPDPLKLPDLDFMFTDTVLAFDHLKHRIQIISCAEVEGSPRDAYRKAVAQILALEKQLLRKRPSVRQELEGPSGRSPAARLTSNLTREEFLGMVKEAKEHIAAGDIIQVVLSQRLKRKVNADPFDVYRLLRAINPSPYMFFLQFGKTALVGSSPEVMVRKEKNFATLRPIAGTRPRGKTEEEDRRLAEELLGSAKECAEHVMLVDLARNDLGRVCLPGTVAVTEKMLIERYSHVMHIVSNVTGRLLPDKDAFDLVRATFPAGTVTGAPKVRAMEIIESLERERRGPYAGAVGYFGYGGDLDTGITIRTIIIKGKDAFIQAGAGIVADSSPESEYQETLNKAEALIRAVTKK